MQTKSYRHMSAEERETLSLGLAPSTVSREWACNAGRLRRAYPDKMEKQLLAETIYAGL